ncbi:MAG: zinc ribbon domain-containing protein [Thiomargarita sp.]|nr:zinc ribbon domain-containing protein [Thiomargarita sp.]
MPIYEYSCKECGHELEVLQKMNDALLKTCPVCKKDSLKKLISASSFQLKGSGWYETDFKNKKKPEKETTNKEKNTKPEKNAKKSDTKKSSTKESTKKAENTAKK